MMANDGDEIIVRYKADLDQLTRELNKNHSLQGLSTVSTHVIAERTGLFEKTVHLYGKNLKIWFDDEEKYIQVTDQESECDRAVVIGHFPKNWHVYKVTSPVEYAPDQL